MDVVALGTIVAFTSAAVWAVAGVVRRWVDGMTWHTPALVSVAEWPKPQAATDSVCREAAPQSPLRVTPSPSSRSTRQ